MVSRETSSGSQPATPLLAAGPEAQDSEAREPEALEPEMYEPEAQEPEVLEAEVQSRDEHARADAEPAPFLVDADAHAEAPADNADPASVEIRIAEQQEQEQVVLPAEVRVVSLVAAEAAPEPIYASAEAAGGRRPATSPISVSVSRPWIETGDPAPTIIRHGNGSEVPAQLAGIPPAPSQPLVESISLLDDSTPLALEVAEDTRRRLSLAGRRFPRPRNTRVVTVSNQKGGVGKTTTTVNLAAALAQAGLRVLVLDIDPQGNASTALGIDHHAEVPSIYDVLVEGRALSEVIQACPDVENLWCAPATIDLAGAEIELVSLVARESRLQRAVSTYLASFDEGADRLDYILIDCPPSLGLLTVNAFVAAREVLIPIQCEYYALEGLSQLLKNVELIRGHLNPELHVSTILLTMYDGRTRLSSQVADEVRTHFPQEVLKTTVPRSVRISEAPSHGQTVLTYDPASSGALSYLEAARELAEQVLAEQPHRSGEGGVRPGGGSA